MKPEHQSQATTRGMGPPETFAMPREISGATGTLREDRHTDNAGIRPNRSAAVNHGGVAGWRRRCVCTPLDDRPTLPTK